jgi:hypothetical protein
LILPELSDSTRSSTDTLRAVRPVREVAPGNDLTEFIQEAAARGFSPHEVALMSAALPCLGLPAATAASWMASGFTPWAVPAWQHNAFRPEEAADARARGESPESAYFARLDRRHPSP